MWSRWLSLALLLALLFSAPVFSGDFFQREKQLTLAMGSALTTYRDLISILTDYYKERGLLTDNREIELNNWYGKTQTISAELMNLFDEKEKTMNDSEKSLKDSNQIINSLTRSLKDSQFREAILVCGCIALGAVAIIEGLVIIIKK